MRGHYVELVPPNEIGDFKTFYDKKIIDGTKTEIRFFDTQASLNVLNDNYEEIPFPGNRDYFVVGVNFEPIMPVLTHDAGANVYPWQFANVLQNSVVEMRASGRSRQIFSVPLPLLMSLEDMKIEMADAISTDGLGWDVDEQLVATWQQYRERPFWQPFFIKKNQTFYLNLNLPAKASLIDAADLSGQPGDFGLRCKMSVAFQPSR